MPSTPPLVVLDDDPTGTQAVRGVPVLLTAEPQAIARAAADEPRAIHLMTNTRALPPGDAETTTRVAAEAALDCVPGARTIVRGDSTLRGHLLEEHRAVEAARGLSERCALLLVPALPTAGRVTRDGVHLLARDGGFVPLHDTEYARDGVFRYRSSRLLDWAEERSRGRFVAARGTEVPLRQLRASGPAAVADALTLAAEAGGRAACVPDAESVADLELIAEGLRQAERAGVPVIARCAPTFAGVLAGNLAVELSPAPRAAAGVLIVCGSYVGGTTAQLEQLAEARGVEPIFLDASGLASDAAPALVAAAAERAVGMLAADRVAVVATSRTPPPEGQSLATGARIARALAAIVPAVGDAADVIVAKGGITSAITLQAGVGSDSAWVEGPIAPGVALWRARSRPYIVVPGNVGGPELLTDLVDLLRGG